MKKGHRILSIILACTCLNFNLSAQDSIPKKIKEYGIGFANLNSFSLQYHWGNEYRIQNVSLSLGLGASYNPGNGNFSNSNGNQYVSYSGTEQSPYNLSFGLGYLNARYKKVNDKFGFNLGYQTYLSVAVSKVIGSSTSKSNGTVDVSEVTTTNQNFRPGAGYMLGVYYKFSKELILYAAVAPSIYYYYGLRIDQRKETISGPSQDPQKSDYKNITHTNNLGFSFSNGGAFITLAYRITYNAKN